MTLKTLIKGEDKDSNLQKNLTKQFLFTMLFLITFLYLDSHPETPNLFSFAGIKTQVLIPSLMLFITEDSYSYMCNAHANKLVFLLPIYLWPV